ncbi:hypothetical protein [Photobacterium leiognathi]|uniref:hypothetical protein n=1 Tax=Photobacterium leiognathi TaxID=553611 RepID=UPI0029812376|nr:hypothetical protein [Photobacterium leiognathi]
MIKIDYIFNDKCGEIELGSLTGFESKDDILDSIGIPTLEYIIIEDVLQILNPDIDPAPVMSTKERGGYRGEPISPKSEAERLGFSKLAATIDEFKVIIIW